MKILYYINHFLREEEMMGGINIYLASVVSSLLSSGCKITVIEKDPMGYPPVVSQKLHVVPFYQRQTNNRLESFTRKIPAYLGKFFPSLSINLYYSQKFRKNAHDFTKQIKKFEDLDIVQIPNLESLGLFLPQKRNYRLVVRASSYRPIWDETNQIPNTRDIKKVQSLEFEQYKRADNVFAPSRYLANILSEVLNRQVDKISTPVHVNFRDWDLTFVEKHNLATIPYVLFFGVLTKRKGIFDLAEAMRHVWEGGSDLRLVVIGPDYNVGGISNLYKMKKIIGEDFVDDKLIYQLKLNQSQLFPTIKNSLFVISPSLVDNCPNSMLETMEIGRPIIATYDSGQDEFYPGSCKQLLVPKNDPMALASTIIELSRQSGSKLEEIGIKLKKNIEKTNSPKLIKNQLLAYYQS